MLTHHLRMNQPITLLRGCALFENRRARSPHSYILGTTHTVAAVTSAFERTALAQLAEGVDPLSRASAPIRAELENFFRSLARSGMLNLNPQELRTPVRKNNEVVDRDASFKQLRARSAPELLQAEWSDGKSDGGTSTLAARSQFPIELSGRSRVITLLYSILLASGVTRVRFSDRHHKPLITDTDIGFGGLQESDIGLSYYEDSEAKRRGTSLFPVDRNFHYGLDTSKPLAVVHYGDCDPEMLVQWSNQKMAHLVIHAPIGDEIAVGPMVLPGQSPCIRCLKLYEIDNLGFTRLERIDLTTVEELPAVTAHYIAAIVASQILHYIDQELSEINSPSPRNTGVGEVAYINFQKLTEPQVVAIARHPLCGCDHELKSR
jgi:bacteriocin biosynthesis cyclodehydratase domain-containing protein